MLGSYDGRTCYEKTAPDVPVMTLRIKGENSNSHAVKPNIYHVCLANHATEFGSNWNNKVFDWLRSKLLTQAQGDRKSLTDMILTNAKNCLEEYLAEVQTVSFQRIDIGVNPAEVGGDDIDLEMNNNNNNDAPVNENPRLAFGYGKSS